MSFRHVLVPFLCLAALAASTHLLLAQDASKDAPVPKIEDLAWLEGQWRRADGPSLFDEHWMPAAGGTMVGVSRSVEGGKTNLYELSVIERAADGLVLRIRHFGPGLVPWKSEADGPMSWPLASVGDKEVVFEEPSRDFPRRIVYRRSTDEKGDLLTARLDAGKGSPKAMEFRFRPLD